MTFSSLQDYFEFSSLDIKRSLQLSKEFPYILVDTKEDEFKINLGPHTTSIDANSLKEGVPLFNCSCVHFEKKGFCHHLHFLIELLNAQKITKQDKLNPSIKKKALPTLKKMLDNVSNNMLHSFVKQYGRKHKNFAIVLKAKLLRSSTISDTERNYYLDVVNQIIHQRTQPNSPLTLGQLNTFIDVIEIYLEELTSCLEDKDYLNYFYISFAILDRINLVLYRTPAKSSKLLPLWSIAHQHMSELLRRVTAPDLKDEILSSLCDLSSKVYYQYCDYNFNIVQLILKYPPKEHDMTPLVEELISSLKHKESTLWRNGHVAATLQLIHKNKDEKLLSTYCAKHILKAQTYIEIANNLDSAGNNQLISDILFTGHSLLKNASLHEAYIKINAKSWKKDILFDELYLHLAIYKSISPLKSIEFTITDKSKFAKFLNSKETLTEDIPAKIYRVLQRPKELIKNLDPIPLGYLYQYDEILWENCPTKIRFYYAQRISVYLNEYHGNKSTVFITSILSGLQNKAPSSEFDELLQQISTSFEHRTSVIQMAKQFKRSYF